MKYQKRQKMYEVNVWELKTFVLEVAERPIILVGISYLLIIGV